MTRTKQEKLEAFAAAGGLRPVQQLALEEGRKAEPTYLPGLGAHIMPIFAVDAGTRVVHHKGRAFSETLFVHDSYICREYRGRDAKPLGLVFGWIPSSAFDPNGAKGWSK